jgi:hypothetical protein
MTRRIEQSRRHGHFNPRWTTDPDRVHVVADNHLAVVNEPEVPTVVPAPRLELVAGSGIEEDEAIAATPSGHGGSGQRLKIVSSITTRPM